MAQSKKKKIKKLSGESNEQYIKRFYDGPFSAISEEITKVPYKGQSVSVNEFHLDGVRIDKHGKQYQVLRKINKQENLKRISKVSVDTQRRFPWISVRQDVMRRAKGFLKTHGIPLLLTDEEIVGTHEEFKAHIESQFEELMNWYLHGNKKYSWQIHHKAALMRNKELLWTKEGQQKILGLTNIVPLWIEDHIKIHKP